MIAGNIAIAFAVASYSAPEGAIVIGGESRPSYFTGLSAGQWHEVNTNTLDDVDPENDPAINPNHPSNAPWRGDGPQSRVMSAWSGGQWDDKRQGLYIFGGGHGDYAGNELYWWDAATGEFSLLTRPTGAVGNTGTLDDGQESTGVYFDGQPRSVHSYNNMCMRRGILWQFGGSQYKISTPSEHVFTFDGVKWRNNLTNGGGRFGAAVYDPTRDKILVLKEGTHTPRWVDCTAETVGAYPQSITRNGNVQALYLDTIDSFLVIGGSIKIAAADGSAGFTNISTTGTAPASTPGEAGYVWDERRNRVLCWFGGQDVYTLTPPGSDPVNSDWTWGALTVSGVTPTAQSGQGTYGRFWYSHKLDCIGVVNSTTQNMYVCPLS